MLQNAKNRDKSGLQWQKFMDNAGVSTNLKLKVAVKIIQLQTIIPCTKVSKVSFYLKIMSAIL